MKQGKFLKVGIYKRLLLCRTTHCQRKVEKLTWLAGKIIHRI